MARWPLGLVGWLIPLVPAPAPADGCAVGSDWSDGGTAGTLSCVQNDDVRMVAERVVFTETPLGPDGLAPYYYHGEAIGERIWEIEAHYLFQNLTDRDVTLTIAFPVEDGREEQDRTFRVRVDGRRVAHTVQASGDRRNYVFEATFPARARLEMRIEYHQYASYELVYMRGSLRPPDLLSWRLPFILETGRFWSGTIGTIELEYRFAVPTSFGVDEDFGWSGSSAPTFEEEVTCAGNRTVVRLRAHDVEPDGNIILESESFADRVGRLEAMGCTAFLGRGADEQDCCSLVQASNEE